MVLFTLLGLTALFLRDRKNGNNTHSGQDENVDQSDDLPPLESDDGQTSRDISSDPVVLPTTEEPITGDSQVDDDWSQDQSLEEPVIGDPQDGDDSSDDVSYSPPEDTVGPHLSQQQDINGTIIEINSKSYKIGNQLGKGSFGTVFEATRLEDDVQVAVKFASIENSEYVSVVSAFSSQSLFTISHISC